MPDPQDRLMTARMTGWIGAAGAVLSGFAFLFGGASVGTGAVVGAALAAGNWWVLSWILRRGLASRRGAGALLFLLLLKMAVLGGVCYFLVAVAGLNVLGFAVGLTALVFGLVVGSALSPPSSDHAEGECAEGETSSPT